VTGTYDPGTNQTIWGTGNSVPMVDPTYRPGDNLYTNSAISWDPDTGKMNWFFQFTPGDMWDYDEVGTHILIDGNVSGQPRKLRCSSERRAGPKGSVSTEYQRSRRGALASAFGARTAQSRQPRISICWRRAISFGCSLRARSRPSPSAPLRARPGPSLIPN